MSDIAEKILSAVDIIVSKAVAEAAYDKTIQANVVSCVDQTIGKYECRYQDSKFYAYTTNSDVTYTNGSEVYVLVPGNDFSRHKTILGTTKKLGINYVGTVEGDEAYQVNGNNCIDVSGVYQLSSYHAETRILYSKNGINLLTLNKTAVNEYIKSSKTLICGAKFKTTLPVEQQFRGNFGIIFGLDFMDNAAREVVTRYYVVDVDKMTGNPYKQTYGLRQYGIFDIDNNNFKEVNSISVFCYDFPNSKDSGYANDIFISEIELSGAARLSDDDINNYSLTFFTPDGTYFDVSSLATDKRRIKAQVRVKGKVVDTQSQSLSYFWFVEHAGVTSNSRYYNKYGGQGWKCLNQYTELKREPLVVEWIPGAPEIEVAASDITAKEVKYKCVAIYDGTAISNTLVIKNLASGYDISIESDSGTKFYFDQGFPTLTCKVNGVGNQNYTYIWAVTDNTGSFTQMAETVEDNNRYNNAVAAYNALMTQIQNETAFYEANRVRLDGYRATIDSYDQITRVEKNKIHKLNMNTVVDFSNFQCSVFSGNLYLGTASITLVNKLQIEGVYRLVIENGVATYKYNENGRKPNSAIKALTFSLYDTNGNRVDDSVTRHCDIEWIVPTDNTMLKIPDNYHPDSVDLINKTATYTRLMSFSYLIETLFNEEKYNNDIVLNVNYNGTWVSAITDFNFTKEGANGTNGTNYSCRIVPNVPVNVVAPDHVTLTWNSSNQCSYNFTPQNANIPFRVELYHDEERVFNAVTSGNSNEGGTVGIKWSVHSRKNDVNAFSINATTGRVTLGSFTNAAPANIVKATVTYKIKGKTIEFHAFIPVITVKLYNDNYKINLRDKTGFTEAMYTPDGVNPQYDSKAFELLIQRKINGYWEDVTAMTSSGYAITYTWQYLGKNKTTNTDTINLELDRTLSRNDKTYQRSTKPVSTYDGECLNNAVYCLLKQGNTTIGEIHVPVHLYLNQYGNAALNSWDGSSVELNETDGYILAPQIGAGKKETDNSFTGVVMGKVKESADAAEEVGLLGYSKGQRSIFLDAYTGKAEFGAQGKGRFIIDPTNNKAELYSGNYSTTAKTGMKIDLTTPEIRFGSGNFVVDSSGHLTAKGGGSIAGWNIDDDSLFTGTKSNVSNVRLSSVNFERNINGTARTDLRMAFSNNFAITSGGTMIAAQGVIGSGSQKIILGKSSKNGANNVTYSALYSGKSSFSEDSNGFYIGTDGIALGPKNGSHSKFQVNNGGQLIATYGEIGGWSLSSSALTGGKVTLNSSGALSGGKWSIDAEGDAVFKNIKCNDVWSIGTGKNTWSNLDGTNTFTFGNGTIGLGSVPTSPSNYTGDMKGIKFDGSNVTIAGDIYANNGYFKGTIKATSGEIGGWTIEANCLSGANGAYLASNTDAFGYNVYGDYIGCKNLDVKNVVAADGIIAKSYTIWPNKNGKSETVRVVTNVNLSCLDSSLSSYISGVDLTFTGGILTSSSSFSNRLTSTVSLSSYSGGGGSSSGGDDDKED